MAAFRIDARWIWKGNIKLGASIASFATLAGNGTFHTKYGDVKGTCDGVCEHCGLISDGSKIPPCYVFKAYKRYTSRKDGSCSVIDGHARNTLSIMTDPDLSFRQLSDALSRKKTPITACRYSESGEIPKGEIGKVVFRYMCRTASEHPELPFYIYTKRYDVVIPALLNGEVPINLVVLFSVWHEQGAMEFLTVAHLPNVKAFVYCDKNSDPVNGWDEEEYAKIGIMIQTWCMAYKAKGKMNHDVTCDKCQKCFNHRNCHKVIACWDH